MRRSWYLWCILLLYFLMSCAKVEPESELPSIQEVSTENNDTGLVTHEPCAPPCWQGISPGMSRAEATALIQSLPVIDQETLVRDHENLCWESGCVFFDEDMVSEVLYGMAYKLELQRLIAIYGDPDGYIYDLDTHATRGVVELYWFQEGIMVYVPSPTAPTDIYTESPVRSTSVIGSACYFEPVSDAESFFARRGIQVAGDRTILEDIGYVDWEGYVPITLEQ